MENKLEEAAKHILDAFDPSFESVDSWKNYCIKVSLLKEGLKLIIEQIKEEIKSEKIVG